MTLNNCSFLTVAYQGRASWKLYLVGILLTSAIAAGIILAAIVPIIIIDIVRLAIPLNDPNLEQLIQDSIQSSLQRVLFFSNVQAVGVLFGLYITMTRFHRRAFLTLVSADTSIRWQRIFHSFLGWLVPWTITVGTLTILQPQRYVWVFNWMEWWPISLWAAVSFVVSAIAGGFYFAYLFQALGTVVRKPILLTMVWIALGLLTWIGGEPSALDLFVQIANTWIVVWLTLKDDRLELAFGVWLAWAVANWLIENQSELSFQVPGFLELTDPISGILAYISVLMHVVIFYLICFGWPSHPFSLIADRNR